MNERSLVGCLWVVFFWMAQGLEIPLCAWYDEVPDVQATALRMTDHLETVWECLNVWDSSCQGQLAWWMAAIKRLQVPASGSHLNHENVSVVFAISSAHPNHKGGYSLWPSLDLNLNLRHVPKTSGDDTILQLSTSLNNFSILLFKR